MDAAIADAGRALHAGDPLAALRSVALRDDPAALALRGIAMAQLGELARARELLRRAARRFGPGRPLERARCATADAEVALAARELARPPALAEAVRTLSAHGDGENLALARLVQARRSLLLGRIDEAAARAALDLRTLPPRLAAVAALVLFEIALRRARAGEARRALSLARAAAERSGVAALRAEVAEAGRALVLPAARLVEAGAVRPLNLAQVEAVLASSDLVVDGCRRAARRAGRAAPLSRRPVLFALLVGLAGAWPGEAAREELIERAFGARRWNASHRARLRVEMARLRAVLRPLADVRADGRGFRLVPGGRAAVRLLLPPVESPDAAVLALLADGEAWSSSALAAAVGTGQRTVQRALGALVEAGQARALGQGRSRRWLSATIAGFATTLLLPVAGAPG